MTEQDNSEQALADFIANGGKIQQIAIGVSGRVEGEYYSPWGAPRKAGRPPLAKSIAPILDPVDDLDE